MSVAELMSNEPKNSINRRLIFWAKKPVRKLAMPYPAYRMVIRVVNSEMLLREKYEDIDGYIGL
jgi:hypothetical protein